MIELKENLIHKTPKNDSNSERSENHHNSNFSSTCFPFKSQASFEYFMKG